METLMYALILGIIPAIIAENKGHSWWKWYIAGSLMLIAALPAAIFISPTPEAKAAKELANGRRKCPYCGESIATEATICRFCNSSVDAVADISRPSRTRKGTKYVLIVIAVVIGIPFIEGVYNAMHVPETHTNQLNLSDSSVDSVSQDYIQQFYLAKRDGTPTDACFQVRLVVASLLQNNNIPEYERWRAIQRQECGR